MEELQSTEVLDKEILEDARKKAFRTLKAADDAIKDAELAWERKTKAALNELRGKYAEKTKRDGDDIMARLVQDKRRSRSVKIEALLKDAANGYISGLDKKQQLSLLEAELANRLDALGAAGEPITAEDAPAAMARAVSEAEAGKIIANAFYKKAHKDRNAFWTLKQPDMAFADSGIFPAITINTKKVKVTASLDDAVSNLLEDKRAELTQALLGEAAVGGEA
jgi:hypothetical protein